ncbi:MAG: PilT/PilU family type 4a pilus ATPase [Planctomycetes bacterium]|nr:PilT/PilU family type 4a pilus ATPase [Planctomycetota bacterium]
MNAGEVPAINRELQLLLAAAIDRDASDIHLIPGHPASFRIHGRLQAIEDSPRSAASIRAMAESILPPRLAGKLDESKNLDFSMIFPHKGEPRRFRANLFLAEGEWCACLRNIPSAIPAFEWMGFPEALGRKLVSYPSGLVVITGVTGSGKSTTLAALINLLNQSGGKRIITVEEPVEYIHRRVGNSIVTQREVGRDVDSFLDGLKFGLRQDPDVILVGEIRDRETAQMALSAAETGHLILTTLHTQDAKGAITRLVDLFPHEGQDEIRTQLALCLRSVVTQHLLPPAMEGDRRILAVEVLHVNQPVRVGIRFGKIESIESAIQTGKKDGMWTLDEDLQRLAQSGRITLETARRYVKDIVNLRS